MEAHWIGLFPDGLFVFSGIIYTIKQLTLKVTIWKRWKETIQLCVFIDAWLLAHLATEMSVFLTGCVADLNLKQLIN